MSSSSTKQLWLLPFNKYDYLIILVLSGLVFLASKQVLNLEVFAVLTLTISFYFFPLKLLVLYGKGTAKHLEAAEVLGLTLAAVTIAMSVAVIYAMPNKEIFKTYSYGLNVINILLLIYCHIKNRNQQKRAHLALLFLLTLMIWG